MTCVVLCISIHASAREATCPHVRYGLHFLYFNPRLREGGDTITIKVDNRIIISIHASAREATNRVRGHKVIYRISIHASAREATRVSKAVLK